LVPFIEECSQVWHAGDWLNTDLIQLIEKLGKPLQAVFGNIDGSDVKAFLKEEVLFECEGKKVLMRHIAGYPGKYNKRTFHLIKKHQPDIVVAGHSHILKVIRDKELNHLHLNPGAAGIKGFHKVRTMLRFKIDNGKIFDMDVIELASRRLIKENQNEQ
jgi:hypothetical protein